MSRIAKRNCIFAIVRNNVDDDDDCDDDDDGNDGDADDDEYDECLIFVLFLLLLYYIICLYLLQCHVFLITQSSTMLMRSWNVKLSMSYSRYPRKFNSNVTSN